MLQKSVEVVKESLKDDSQKKISAEEYVQQKKRWEKELEQVRLKLNASQRVSQKYPTYVLSVDFDFKMKLRFQQLEENSGVHGKWEHDLLILRQSLQASATRDMAYGLGQPSAETLSIEAELSQVYTNLLHKDVCKLWQSSRSFFVQTWTIFYFFVVAGPTESVEIPCQEERLAQRDPGPDSERGLPYSQDQLPKWSSPSHPLLCISYPKLSVGR